MADKFSIKDLPATDSLIDGNSYMVSGKLLKALTFITKQLWRGENVNRGPNIYLKQFGDGGYSISSTAAPLLTGSASNPTPFQITATKHMTGSPPTWNNTYDVSLYPGTVNQLLPTNIFSTINQGISSTLYVILSGESDGYSITSLTWSLASSPPASVAATADTPPSSFTVLIGIIFYNAPVAPATVGTLTIYQIIQENLVAVPSQWTVVSKTGVGPYDGAYTIYWVWSVSVFDQNDEGD